jgi:hypothetical protein
MAISLCGIVTDYGLVTTNKVSKYQWIGKIMVRVYNAFIYPLHTYYGNYFTAGIQE